MGDGDHVIRVLFVSVLVEVIGFGILFPIIPLLLTEPGSRFYILPAAMSVQTGYLLLGILIASYPIGQFFATPVLGQLSDRYGRRSMLILSIAGTVLANIVFAAGIILANLPLLFVSRIINGLTGGNISIVQAAIADISTATKKASNLGKIGAAFGIGFIIGPFLGGVLSSPGIHPFLTAATPFLFAAALSTMSLLFVYRALPETAPMHGTGGIDWLQGIHNIRMAFTMPERRRLFTVSFLYFSGFTFFTSFIPVYLIARFGLDQFAIGNVFLFIGVLVLIGQLKVVPFVADRFDEARVLPVALFLTGFFILVQLVPQNLIPYLLVLPLFSFSNAVSQVFTTTLISNTGSADDQGLVLGINTSLRALGQALPSALAGAAAALFAPATPLLIGGSIIILAALGYVAVSRAESLDPSD